MNSLFGRGGLIFGRSWKFGGKFGGTGSGGGVEVLPTTAIPGEYVVRAFNSDGTKLAEWGSSIKNNPVLALDFELLTTGCGAFTLKLSEQPDTAALNYGMRIDIHLFGDVEPWYSGYVVERPVAGTTELPYQYKGYGFFQQLEWVLVSSTYEGMDIATIARMILQNTIEPDTNVLFNASKVINTGYTVTKLRFDNVDAKEAIQQLAEFATGYVYGVDAAREFFFQPVTTTINEQARLYVGVHINSYAPTEDLKDLCNYAIIQGAALDDGGSNVLATVQDATSQASYGLRKKVMSIPSAVTAADATRWGQQEIARLKDPIRKAKIKGLRLEWPNSDGTYNVRRIKPTGKAAITPLDGSTAHEYPINKVKYSVTSNGIIADVDLGEQARTLESWYVLAVRTQKNAEALQALNNVQLTGGTL